MSRKSPVAVFLAASAILASNSLQGDITKADEMGGLKEWTTDQGIDDEGKLDEQAQKAKKKANEEHLCIPVGEGENCW